MLTLEQLREDVELGVVDTVVAAFTDMQGRLIGKRLDGDFFLEEADAGHPVEGCNYLLALDMEMSPEPGYEMASWERGYGDFDLRPDLGTLRRVPWLEGTALVLCDVLWHDGTPVGPSPRQVLRRQIERAEAIGFTPMVGSELEFFLFRESYEQARAQHFRGLTPSVPYILDYHILASTYDEPLLRRIRTEMKRAGMRVESSKGEAGAGQHEINFRFADALRAADDHVIYKNGAKEIAHQEGCSITFMAKPDHADVGSSCHIHSSLWREGRNVFGEDDAVFGPVSRRSDRLRARAGDLLRADGQLVQAFRGRELGTDDAGVGQRQPHVRLPRRRARRVQAPGDTDPRRRRQPVSRLRGADRRGPARDRAGARAGAGARGQRLRFGRRALPVDAS